MIRVLAHGYEIKAQGDYGTGPDAVISVQSAEETIADAMRFLKAIKELLR